MTDEEKRERITLIIGRLRERIAMLEGHLRDSAKRHEKVEHSNEAPCDADAITEMGAQVNDILAGREYIVAAPTAAGRLANAARGTTTRKVRKALGFSYP